MNGPILTGNFDLVAPASIDTYLATGGYTALARVLKKWLPEQVVGEVKRSGLRGRGGAGFPTGLKWEIAAGEMEFPKYLIANADEGEPGTFKDRFIIERDPHLLLEGMALAAFAIGAREGYIYIRGEYPKGLETLTRAIEEATARRFLGDGVLGSDFSFAVKIHRGAGAYVCGEETALIESMEGKRGKSRIRPPFPVNIGLWGKPTVVNNVETLANIPAIILRGGDWYAAIGPRRCPGPKIYSLSGDVSRPGIYELPMGTTLRTLIMDYGGGMRDGREFKAAHPGGISSPLLGTDLLDTPLDYNSLAEVGSMMGSGAVIVFGSGTCMVKTSLRSLQFYAHESCGKCIPCREGMSWLPQIVARILAGGGREKDLALLEDLSESIRATAFCGLGEAAVNGLLSSLSLFREEWMGHISAGGCPEKAAG